MDHPAGEDVPEIARWNDEADVVAVVGWELGEGVDVIDALGEDADDVDRVDRGEAHLFLEGQIAHQLLHDGLGVIEGALDRDRVDVVGSRAGHLALLQLGDASFGVENEDLGPLLAGEAMDRGGTGVARGRPEDVDGDARAFDLLLKQAADALQAEILEGKAWPVEEFENEEIVGELLQRRVHRVAEVAVAAIDDVDEMLAVVVAVEEAQEIPGEGGVGQCVLNEDGLRQEGEVPRHVEAAIGGETACKSLVKTDRLTAAAR